MRRVVIVMLMMLTDHALTRAVHSIRASVRHYDLSRRGLAAAALRAIVTTHDDRDNIRRGHWTQTGTGVRWA